MWRVLVALGTILFSLGTLAGLLLVGMELHDGNPSAAGSVATGTIVLAIGAWCFRRDWQRANQARAFARESRRDPPP